MYLLVIQDLFTKWIEVKALKTVNGKLIRDAIEDLIITRWEIPRCLMIDNGTEFVNKMIAGFASECGIRHITVPPYHAQANPVERVNRVLKIS